MKCIENTNFPYERDLYAASDLILRNCTFDGPEDGESALKEAKNIKLESCYLNLRYPLWHDTGVELYDVLLTDKCRAALWYTEQVSIRHSRLLGIKALRECRGVTIDDSQIVSPEFGWKSREITVSDSEIESEYLFFLASHLRLNDVKFRGKYSFQYVEDAVISDSILNTKDAFWHSKNVTVKNCLVSGEYLAWYSENLTLIDCKIVGTQPLCYCKGLKLINCEMEGTDLAFEYSEVDADVRGTILSVKNPRAGRITADGISDLIYTADSKYECTCEIRQRSVV